MDTGLLGLMLYCAGIVGGVVVASWVVEIWDKFYNPNNWRNRITARDIEDLKRMFEEEGAFVGFNEHGEKFLVGYKKD